MDFTNAIKDAMEPLAQDIAALCRVNSVKGEAKPNMPFGEGPAKALEATLELARSMGFETENFNNYVGHINYGEGEEMLGVVGHVDVVPAGDGWEHDPWGGEISNGVIWGRGTQDNKGPVVTALYALKILRDSGVKLNKRVRFILGTDEETNWDCMNYYLKEVKPEMPTISFSPDSRFPVIFAEKAMIQFVLSKKMQEDVTIAGGKVFNSVPSSAEVVLDASMEEALKAAIANSEEADMYSYTLEEGAIKLHTSGIGAHAARLFNGKNAVSYMMKLLGQLPITGDLKDIVAFYNDCFGTCIYGEKMGMKACDETGDLTLNVGKIEIKDGYCNLYCDCRMPFCVTMDQAEAMVKERIADSDFTYELKTKEGSLYVPQDSFLVTTLMNAYQKVTGDVESKPIASGGATYARMIPNCVTCGCLLPDQKDTMHEANECLELAHLEIWLKVLVEAIYQLAQ